MIRTTVSPGQCQLGGFAVEHGLADGLTIRNRTTFADYDKFYQNIYPSSFSPATGLVTLDAYNNTNNRQNLFSQTDLVWESRLGGVDQTVLIGFELGRQKSRNHRLTGTFLNGKTVLASDPTADKDVVFTSTPADADNRTRATVAAIYVQDQVRPADWLEIVAGLRFDSFKLDVNDLRPASVDFSRKDELWSPRVGLILEPRDNLSIYTGYSRSYLPQSGDQFSGLTSTTAELKPGADSGKSAPREPIDGILTTVAAYRLTHQYPCHRPATQRIVLTGAQRSRASVVRSNGASATAGGSRVGWRGRKPRSPDGRAQPAVATCKVPLVPRGCFSLWNRYVSDALGLVSASSPGRVPMRRSTTL